MGTNDSTAFIGSYIAACIGEKLSESIRNISTQCASRDELAEIAEYIR